MSIKGLRMRGLDSMARQNSRVRTMLITLSRKTKKLLITLTRKKMVMNGTVTKLKR